MRDVGGVALAVQEAHPGGRDVLVPLADRAVGGRGTKRETWSHAWMLATMDVENVVFDPLVTPVITRVMFSANFFVRYLLLAYASLMLAIFF